MSKRASPARSNTGGRLSIMPGMVVLRGRPLADSSPRILCRMCRSVAPIARPRSPRRNTVFPSAAMASPCAASIKRSIDHPMPNIRFDDFRELATRPGLETHQRIDDPTDIRAGKHDRIFADIVGKLPVLAGRDRVIAEIGPGCGPLA